MAEDRRKTVLCIAGSDNTGGAGIQVDIKTCAAFEVYPFTVITAVTAQNPSGVKAVKYVGDDMLKAQLETLLEYVRPDAVKIGLLPNGESVEIISEILDENDLKNIVLDPVLGASAGGEWCKDEEEQNSIIHAIKYKLFPLVKCVTPNVKELHRLCYDLFPKSDSIEDCVESLLHCDFLSSVVVTGGDQDSEESTDELFEWDKDNYKYDQFSLPKIDSVHTHGSGCTFSTAIACNLALGQSLRTSVKQAKKFVYDSIIRGAHYPVLPVYGPVHPL